MAIIFVHVKQIVTRTVIGIVALLACVKNGWISTFKSSQQLRENKTERGCNSQVSAIIKCVAKWNKLLTVISSLGIDIKVKYAILLGHYFRYNTTSPNH